MIRGQQVFTQHFSEFQDCYVIIGGLAIDVHMDNQGLPFRATRDFDIILVFEALRPSFFDHFWRFIKEGDYQRKETVDDGQRRYYRFIKPTHPDYPYQIELVSKRPDVIPIIEGHQIVPIPADHDISSLSAVLMDEDYYALTRENSVVVDGLRIATEPLLICLKIKAFLDLSQKRTDGLHVDSRDIKKHQNDVFRLGVILTGQDKIYVPESIFEDLNKFFHIVEELKPEIKPMLKNMGITISIQVTDIMEVTKSIFIKK